MRVLARFLLFFLAVVLVLGPALYLARDSLAPRLVSWLARSSFGLAGLGPLDFKIVDFGAGRLTLADLTVGGGTIGAAALDVAFTYAELRQGRIRALTLRGLTVRASYGADGLDLGPLDALLKGDGVERPGAGPGGLSVGRLVIEDARVRLATPHGPVTLRISLGASRNPDGAMAASGDVRVAITSGTLSGGGLADLASRFEATMSAAGDIDASATIHQGSARFRDLALASVIGDITGRWAVGVPPTARTSLTLAGLRLAGSQAPETTIEALLRGDSATATVTMGDARRTGEAFVLALALDGMTRERARLTVTADGAVAAPLALAVGITDPPVSSIDGTLALRVSGTLPGPLSDGMCGPWRGAAWRDLLRRTVTSGDAKRNGKARAPR
jgi:hypothetical protein